MTRLCSGLVAAALLTVSVHGQDTAPLAPGDVIRSSNARMATILAPNRRPTASETRQALDLIRAITDFPSVARAVIGPIWDTVPSERQREFISTFSELVGRSAIDRLGQYRADRIEYLGEDVDGDRATVRTVAVYDKRRIPLDYVMVHMPAGWRIVDYRFNRVLTSDNYRRQFDQLLAKESFDQLLARLRKRLPGG